MDVDLETIDRQLPYCLDKTDFDFLGQCYRGKVRDCYSGETESFLVTSDRLSAFDVVLTTIPFKGQALTALSEFWFEKTADIVQNHLISVPDPNVLHVRHCEIVPVELVVRGYLAGSGLRDYQAGRPISGHQLPPGLKPYQSFEQPLITPSTKAEQGEHDMPISEQEILSSGLVDAKLWAQICEVSLALFSRGQQWAQERGLILADTKYEFGLLSGELVLADEIHTLDSSRYWEADSYDRNLQNESAPKMLDKENIRQWLLEKGYQGQGTAPEIPDSYRSEVSKLYLTSYERITGQQAQIEAGPANERIEKALRSYLN